MKKNKAESCVEGHEGKSALCCRVKKEGFGTVGSYALLLFLLYVYCVYICGIYTYVCV